MPVILALRFPWRRYHATPWGRYVNEGAVELPPSPWRLLRALYSVWRLRAPELDADLVHGLLGKLAVPPSYVLPPYRLSHTRHYYPDSKHRSGKPSTDKALDAFAVLDGDATIYAIWPVEPSAEESDALARLAKSIPYLGRADSRCDAELLGELPVSVRGRAEAVPLGLDAELPADMLRTDLLSPALPLDVAALTRRPVDVRAAKLVYPPGSRLVPYAVPAPVRAARRERPRRPAERKVTAVRLAFTGPVLPPLTETVPLADAVRYACIQAVTRRRSGPGTSVLAGKHADGSPLRDHRHAHFLPLDIDHDRRIDEILIWAPDGIPPEELAALDALSGWTIGVPEGVPGPRGLGVRIVAFGGDEVIPGQWTAPSRRWRSLTPFVPSRHRKPRQTVLDFLDMEIRRELSYRSMEAALTSVRERPGGQWPLFIRHRWRKGTRADGRVGHGLELEFTESVSGPLAIGHLSHFGLGLFVPAGD